jgi:hypothetical protein
MGFSDWFTGADSHKKMKFNFKWGRVIAVVVEKS